MNKESKQRESGIVMASVKGALIASIASLMLILAYAFALKQGWLSTSSTAMITPAIKVICAALAALLATRHCTKMRWLCGAIAGLIYVLLAFMVFSILSSTFDFSLALLSDMGMGAVSGMLAAIVRSMFK
ncbi:MAG: TIGR04086 family membrane protein [Clostridia bacterium]